MRERRWREVPGDSVIEARHAKAAPGDWEPAAAGHRRREVETTTRHSRALQTPRLSRWLRPGTGKTGRLTQALDRGRRLPSCNRQQWRQLRKTDPSTETVSMSSSVECQCPKPLHTSPVEASKIMPVYPMSPGASADIPAGPSLGDIPPERVATQTFWTASPGKRAAVPSYKRSVPVPNSL